MIKTFPPIFLVANPFYQSYLESDFLGKGIFIALYLLSIGSWIILLYKVWVTYRARKNAFRFYDAFQLQKLHPLSLDGEHFNQKGQANPFLDLYCVLKKQAMEIFSKNKQFQTQPLPQEGAAKDHSALPTAVALSLSDLDFLAAQLASRVAQETKRLERYLYLLSTTVSLAPFLGLLGTVWGILTTFSHLQADAIGGGTHQFVLGGLSMALATTVLGLVDAIPALIGYNYLKNTIRDFTVEMEGFSQEMLASVELQYRKPDF